MIGTGGALLRALWRKILRVGTLALMPCQHVLTKTDFPLKPQLIPYNILTIRPIKLADKHAAYQQRIPTGDPGRKQPTLLLDLQDPTTRLPEAISPPERMTMYSKQHGEASKILLELSSTTGTSHSSGCNCICITSERTRSRTRLRAMSSLPWASFRDRC